MVGHYLFWKEYPWGIETDVGILTAHLKEPGNSIRALKSYTVNQVTKNGFFRTVKRSESSLLASIWNGFRGFFKTTTDKDIGDRYGSST